MHFETDFILDREHYAECFEQSMKLKGPQKPRTFFMLGLVAAGLFFLFFSNVQPLLPWFFFAIAILEFFSFKYRRAWWLSRQMMSKNAGNKITLIFDEQGIENRSVYINQKFSWQSIQSYQELEAGYMLNLEQGKQQYLSKSCLDEQITSFLTEQLQGKQVAL